MSSVGTNVRPTILLSGNDSRKAAADTPITVSGCASVHLSDLLFTTASQWKKPASFVLLSPTASESLRKRELSIGVNVKLTIIEMKIENAIVQPNGKMKRRAKPVMNATGRKMTIRDSVVAITASATSRV